MDNRAAVDSLISDLHGQIDQFKPRGIKNSAGHTYVPSRYKPRLKEAIAAREAERRERVDAGRHKLRAQGLPCARSSMRTSARADRAGDS
jgi:hypothetical protein